MVYHAPPLKFVQLINPTPEIAESFSKWENDPALIPFMRPNANEEDLIIRRPVTVDDIKTRLEHDHIYLIYMQDVLIGEMDYQMDPAHLFKKESGTAWIGIAIGEAIGRGRGIGFKAMQYLEGHIKEQGIRRIELGVFEFNANALRLYRKLGYSEIGRIGDFTYWQGRLWQDIRMEKYP